MHEVVQQLAALTDPPMRQHALGDRLLQAPVEDAVRLLDALILGVLEREPAAAVVYPVLIDPQGLLERLGQGRVGLLIRMAQERQARAACVWLRSPAMPEPKRPPDSQRLVAQDLQHMTLGERRAAARRPTAAQLDRLLLDPDPGVIGNLLRSPRLTESHVIRLCAQRPAACEALEVVLQIRRWARRPTVRRALVRNPYFNQTLAVNLLPLLAPRVLEDVEQDGGLAEPLRMAARIYRELAGRPALLLH